VEEVGLAGMGTVHDVGRATDHFRDHRQAADKRGQHIGCALAEQLPFHVGPTLPRIHLIHGGGGQERLQTGHKIIGDDEFPEHASADHAPSSVPGRTRQNPAAP